MVEVRNYWPGANVCCGYLGGINVGLGYLGRDRFQLRKLMHLIKVPGCTYLVEGQGGHRNPVYGYADVLSRLGLVPTLCD